MKILLSLAVLGLIAFFLTQTEAFSFSEVRDSIQNLKLETVLAAFFLVWLQNILMAIRLWFLFPKANSIPVSSAIHGVLYGQCLNTFVPARAGDVLKAVVFSKALQQKNSSVSSTKSSLLISGGVLVADKLVDIVALLLIVFLSGAAGHSELITLPQISAGDLGVLLVILLGIGLLLYFFGRTWLSRGKEIWKSFQSGLRGIFEWKAFSLSLSTGLLAWSCEALALMVLCGDQSFPISFSQSVYLLAILNLAIAIPLSVANVGPFEAALIFGLGQLGLGTSPALATAAAHHSIQMAGLLLLTGCLALLKTLTLRSNHVRNS